jgi:hypothetical protein
MLWVDATALTPATIYIEQEEVRAVLGTPVFFVSLRGDSQCEDLSSSLLMCMYAHTNQKKEIYS